MPDVAVATSRPATGIHRKVIGLLSVNAVDKLFPISVGG